MKVKDMNVRQKKAWHNIREAACDIIGGAENAVLDKSEDWEDWQKLLDDYEQLREEIYDRAIHEVCGDCCVIYGTDPNFIRDIRFCGKEWLMERVEKRMKKLGYERAEEG